MIYGKIGDGLPLASIIYIYICIQLALLLCGNSIFANGPKYMVYASIEHPEGSFSENFLVKLAL